MRLHVEQIIAKKKKGERIVMLTAYDYPWAALADECGIDVILVGDSVANVVLGLESTRDVGMEAMIHHAGAVNRAVKKAMVVGDMPFSAYQENPAAAVTNARRFIKEAGCDAVKLEWFDGCLPVAAQIYQAGIPVMGHVGLTPQTADRLGGFKVQGKDARAAHNIIVQAEALEKAGCFAVVLECIPDKLAALITQRLSIPTIGIGAGAGCDGQVLVLHDLLGLTTRFHPKFVKPYADLAAVARAAIRQFQDEVRKGRFPDAAHSYAMSEEEWKKLAPPPTTNKKEPSP